LGALHPAELLTKDLTRYSGELGLKNVPGVFPRFGAVVLGDFYKTISVSDTQRNPM
jgi:hypothetical protein